MIIKEFYSNMHGLDSSIPQFSTCVRGIRKVITSEIVSEVLHVPRVVHPDYPACAHLRTVSKMNSRLYFMRRHLLGVTIKTPLTQPLLKVRDS